MMTLSYLVYTHTFCGLAMIRIIYFLLCAVTKRRHGSSVHIDSNSFGITLLQLTSTKVCSNIPHVGNLYRSDFLRYR